MEFGMMVSGSVWGREPMTRNRRELEKYLPTLGLDVWYREEPERLWC